ncbi:MAG: glycosyltransferase family 2 protein [Fimbriimonadaceae bacterium]|nr:glycosyltransferase family 2 protein [Fimbriimonadaceae bacterium]
MLSVLVVNWNTRELLRACLASLLAHPSAPDDEVVVVDNASTDGSAEMVRTEFPTVRFVASPVNLGYAAGNNRAFSEANGHCLLTLNPDTEVFEDTLAIALERLMAHPGVGALGARQIGPSGEVQASVRGFPAFLGLFGDWTGLGRRWPGTVFDSYRLAAFDYDKEQLAPQPMGTFLLFRREALAAVGDPARPFDESFPIFFNEVDLLARLRAAGWPCLYAPSVRIRHHGGMSTRQVRASMIWESHRSLVRYLVKHRRSFASLLWIGPLALLIFGAAFARARGYHAGFRPHRHHL